MDYPIGQKENLLPICYLNLFKDFVFFSPNDLAITDCIEGLHQVPVKYFYCFRFHPFAKCVIKQGHSIRILSPRKLLHSPLKVFLPRLGVNKGLGNIRGSVVLNVSRQPRHHVQGDFAGYEFMAKGMPVWAVRCFILVCFRYSSITNWATLVVIWSTWRLVNRYSPLCFRWGMQAAMALRTSVFNGTCR